MNWLITITGGLTDGINPCAFATIVFLISYLTAIRKTGKELLLIGICFTASVFFTYFALGCGAYEIIERIANFPLVVKCLKGFIAVLVIGLGLGSLWDWYKSRVDIRAMKLKLPEKLRSKIRQQIIRRFQQKKKLVATTIVLGVVVAILESVCTGQVYLPVIASLIYFKVREAYLYLLVYNLMFIIPIVLVFILAWKGTSNERLSSWSRKHLSLTKLIMSGFFILLGIFILVWKCPGCG